MKTVTELAGWLKNNPYPARERAADVAEFLCEARGIDLRQWEAAIEQWMAKPPARPMLHEPVCLTAELESRVRALAESKSCRPLDLMESIVRREERIVAARERRRKGK